jgi:twitching motility protein PilT
MTQTSRELGDILLEHGLLTEAQLEFALIEEQRTGRSAWRVLLERGEVTERDLVMARARQIGLGYADVRSERPDPEALALLPVEIARRWTALPMRVSDERVAIAMAEPTSHLALEQLQEATGRQVVPVAAYVEDLVGAIEAAYGGGQPSAPPPAAAPTQPAPDVLGADDVVLVEAPPEEPEVAVVAAEGLKGPNLSEFLNAVIDGEGSDLHLTAGAPPMIRVHGDLRPLPGYRPLEPKDLQELIYAILTQKQRETFEENLELDISYTLPGRARFRVNVFQQRDSLGAVMRLIPFGIKSVEELGLPPAVAEFAKLRRGLVLVTGITGSGKSTTLAALIDLVNSTRPDHIMTVEDPIEFLHRHKRSIVNQREVGTDTHGFAEALRHVLRQDPDVILVGELRDLETISTALTAAETGHLVLATLHTQDAPQSVDRVIDVFPPHQQQQIRVQLAGTLAGVVSQQLLPTADGRGRVVAVEVLVCTPAVRNLIREGKTHQIYTSMQAGGKYGMQVMDQHLAELVKKGRVRYEVALERCHKVEEFNRLVGRAPTSV